MCVVSHLGTNWQDQWERVLRWYARLQPIRMALPSAGPAQTEALDFLFAFFMNCYHLQDWVRESGLKSDAVVNSFVFSSEAMKLCRDVCNGVKHYRLDPVTKPTHLNWSTATRSDVVVTRRSAASKTVGGQQPERWVFVTDIGDKDMFELVDDCLAAWRAFLKV